MCFTTSNDPGGGERKGVVVRELLAADVEGIEGVGAVGTVFEQVFFALGKFLAGFVFAEAVATVGNTGGLNGKDKVLVVRAVEEWHEPLLSGEGVVDEKILLVMVHRVSEVHGLDAPAVPLELLNHVIVEVLVVDGIVGAESRCIVIIDHGLVAMRGVITAEVLDECRYFAVELDVKALDDIEAAVARLPGDNPVDVGVVVHAYADGRVGVNVLVSAGVERREVVIVTESIEVLIIVGIILVALAHRGIETVLCNSDPLTKDRGLESQRCKVAFHLLYVVLAEKLQVLDGGILAVVDRDGAHLIEVAVEATQVAFKIRRHRLPRSVKGAYALLRPPNLIDRGLDGLDKLRVHLVAVVEEPTALLGLRHIAQYHN